MPSRCVELLGFWRNAGVHRIEMLLSLALCSKLVWVGMLVFHHVDVVCMPLLSQSGVSCPLQASLLHRLGKLTTPEGTFPPATLISIPRKVRGS